MSSRNVRNYKKVGRKQRAAARKAEFDGLSPQEKQAHKAENKKLYDSQKKS